MVAGRFGERNVEPEWGAFRGMDPFKAAQELRFLRFRHFGSLTEYDRFGTENNESTRAAGASESLAPPAHLVAVYLYPPVTDRGFRRKRSEIAQAEFDARAPFFKASALARTRRAGDEEWGAVALVS